MNQCLILDELLSHNLYVTLVMTFVTRHATHLDWKKRCHTIFMLHVNVRFTCHVTAMMRTWFMLYFQMKLCNAVFMLLCVPRCHASRSQKTLVVQFFSCSLKRTLKNAMFPSCAKTTQQRNKLFFHPRLNENGIYSNIIMVFEVYIFLS